MNVGMVGKYGNKIENIDAKNSSNWTSFMGYPVANIKVPERVVSQFGVA